MDLFTHMMISYLLCIAIGKGTGGLSEPQLLFGVIAGIFLDFDILTFPLWRRFPRLQHHGITHSLIFPVVNSFVLAAFAWAIWGQDPLVLIPIGMVTGVFHVLSDLLTNYPVPLFAPFSWKGHSAFIDSALNPYLMGPVGLVIIGFWWLRAKAYPFEYFIIMLLIVALVMVLHFGVKYGLKVHVRRKYKGDREGVDAFPTFRYRTWLLMQTTTLGETEVTEYLKIKLGSSKLEPMFFEVEGPPSTVELPIDTKEKAIVHSYHELEERIKGISMGIELTCRVLEGKDGDTIDVLWFHRWDRFYKTTKPMLVRVKPDGTYAVHEVTKDIWSEDSKASANFEDVEDR